MGLWCIAMEKVLIPLAEYLELIKLRNEQRRLIEEQKRKIYGLNTTINNLQRRIEKEHGYRSWNG